MKTYLQHINESNDNELGDITIAENILEEDYEAAELNKDSLLWYYQDQFKKYNNI